MTWGNRWEWELTRQTTAGLLTLDVRALNRSGALAPGAHCHWRWTTGNGEPAGDILIRMDGQGPFLTLHYRMRSHGEAEWTPHAQPVWLETTPCHYGGERVWFKCPGCQCRRAVLFSVAGSFRCRGCHDLAYESTREDDLNRTARRIQTLQRRLHPPAGCDLWHIPAKPPYMHGSTYRRLVAQLSVAIIQRAARCDSQLGALAGRLDDY